MSDFQYPPPYAAPPPRKTGWLPWLLGGCGLATVGAAGVLYVIGMTAMKGIQHSVYRPPMRRPAEVRTYPDGWGRYRFRDIGLEIDLPNIPYPSRDNLATGSTKFTQTEYSSDGSFNSISLNASWARANLIYNEAVVFDEAKRYAKTWPGYLGDLKSRKQKLGGLACLVCTFGARGQGYQEYVSLISFLHRGSAQYLIFVHDGPPGPRVKQEFERCERSLAFLPPFD